MANTQLFILELGVTVIQPLGSAIDLLRRDIAQLRTQADVIRFDRLIGEVIRLGLALGAVRQIERQLALDQAQQHGEQTTRLNDEIDAVERLRQHYLLLDQVIAGLSRLKPLEPQAPVWQQHRQVDAGTDPAPPPAGPPANAPAVAAPWQRAVLAAGGLGLTALAISVGGKKAMQRQPARTQRRLERATTQEWQEHRIDAAGKIGKALITDDDGETKARGVGAALGEQGGRLLGTVLSVLSRGKLTKEQGAKFGGYLGEAVGDLAGGRLFRWIMGQGKPNPDPDSSAPAASAAGSAKPEQTIPWGPAGMEPMVVAGFGAAGLTVVCDCLQKGGDPPINPQRWQTRPLVEQRHPRNEAAGDSGEAPIADEAAKTGDPLLGAASPTLSTRKQASKQGRRRKGYFGNAAVDDKAEPDSNEALSEMDARSLSMALEEQTASSSIGVFGSSTALIAMAAGQRAYKQAEQPPANTWPSIPGMARHGEAQGHIGRLDNIGSVAIAGGVDEDKARGVGAAVGDRGQDTVLFRLGRSKPARTRGAPPREPVGDGPGGTLFGWGTQGDRAAPNNSATQPESPGSSVATQPLRQAVHTQDAAASPARAVPVNATARLPSAKGLMKRLPGVALLSTTLELVETYNSDASSARKLEGYGSAVGGLGGTLAGAAAGAVIGSVVPVIGTAVGGLIGGVLGGMGGESTGGWLGSVVASAMGKAQAGPRVEGSSMPGSPKMPDEPAPALDSAPLPVLVASPTAQLPCAPVPQVINQQFTFNANMPVTVNNSFDDPTTLQQLETIARRVLDDLMRQARSVQMADQPHP